ncbi:hypothetical protein JIG36_48690 [Actinoplanes sp. LDG1-06]|uniref:Transmembrane protein n=1 Tax=Paractinoplanes ovalisporus TaxID=2810368 RepID=A0ABS2AU50_9ACTN|nr:hypothetical protein [Actinoplanes ovalisporus]MBM2623400.1 hypothetical protein [Actinoplanes ovalisporus]
MVGTKGERGVTQSAIETRRLVGKVVLFFVLCWVVVLISGISGAAQDAEFKPLNVVMALLPGCAFVPAAYFAVRLHLTSDPDALGQIWPKTLVYGVSGLVLLIGSAYAIYQLGQ